MASNNAHPVPIRKLSGIQTLSLKTGSRKHLRSKGYEFTQQYPVGAYRIDIVVAFNGKKIALECDGEEFHSRPEDVMNDMSRQSVLERNGWRFIRLRGSEFFRNEEKAMERVYRELAGFGIYPKDEKEKAGQKIRSSPGSMTKLPRSGRRTKRPGNVIRLQKPRTTRYWRLRWRKSLMLLKPLKQLKPPKLQKPLWSQELHPAI